MSNVGYSYKINDPAFDKYVGSTKRYSWIFAWMLSIIAIAGFSFYGATSNEMDNPQAFFVGLAIAGMFLTIAFFTNLSRSRSRTWDGVVAGHKTEKKQRKVYNTGNDYYMQPYELYKVIITEEQTGKKHAISVGNDRTVYDYYKDGDKVRHHGKLNTYEKYDKSKDTIIFCNACATLNEISADVCHRCSCPLLK